MASAYISLGANQGNAAASFRSALEQTGRIPGVRVGAVSGIYLTEPQGDAEQPWFSNQAARLDCVSSVAPEALLEALLGIETRLGRIRDAARRFGPRMIDLDLLLFDNVILAMPRLILPHPRMHQRAFVLVPLLELEPRLVLPDGSLAEDALKKLDYRLEGPRIFQP